MVGIIYGYRNYSTMARIKFSFLRVSPIILAVVIFIIGFLWVKPGFLDLGGDSSRLYFYDPINYLKGQSLYSVSPSVLGGENFSYYGIPFFLFLSILKSIFRSPWLLISVFYGFSISLAFVFVYKSVREIIGSFFDQAHEASSVLASLIGGLYYVFSPTPILNWGHNISTYNQVFLNPMIFYFLIKFLHSQRRFYLGIVLLLTIVFSTNFSVVGAPPLLAFYPLTFSYLYFHMRLIKQQSMPWKDICMGFVMFIGIHVFQFFPTVMNIFSPASPIGHVIFSTSGKIDRGQGYFSGLTDSIKVSISWIGLPQLTKVTLIGYLHAIFPFFFFVALLKNKSKSLLLTALFFCFALFWETANITTIGASWYKSLFVIPGFSIFRNYYAQFTYVYLFFYVLLLSQSLFFIFERIKIKYVKSIVSGLSVLLLITAWPLITGSIINSTFPSSTTKTILRMDPSYDKLLSFFRAVPKEGKIMLLPQTDYGYQVLSGIDDNTAYIGPSTISYLTGKQDFSGMEELESWKDQILYLVRTKQYDKFKKIIGLLGVKYIFYNSDPRIYGPSFLDFPYSEVKHFFPSSQQGYREFIDNLRVHELLNIDNKYFVYELDDSLYFPEVYVSTNNIYFDKEISDWTLPLGDEIAGTTRPVVYESIQSKLITGQYIYQATPKDQWDNLIKNQSPELVLHNSFSTTSPNSLLYPLIMIKEELSLKNYFRKQSDDMYIDKRFFFSAKRVFELEKFGPSLNVESGWKWNITRYALNMHQSILKINESTNDQPWKTRQKFLVNEYLQQHRVRLKRALKGASKTKEETAILFQLIDDTFSSLVNELAYPTLYTNELDYKVGIPKNQNSSYDVLFDKNLAQSSGLTVSGSNINLHSEKSKKTADWQNIGSIQEIDTQHSSDSFRLLVDTPVDVMKYAVSTTSSVIKDNVNEKNVDVDATLFKGLSGIFWNIPNWMPNSYYVLTFEYRTQGKEFNLKVYDAGSDFQGKPEYSSLIKDSMATDRWTYYQGIVKSSPFSTRAIIGIVPWLDSGGAYALDLRNISFIQAPLTSILFRKNESGSVLKEPKISINKINSTQYKISVHDVHGPYSLVLNEAFNNNWKVYVSDKGNVKAQISNTRHYRVNGYANGWQILPSDANNAQEYELLVEMVSQQKFYYSAIFSLAFVTLFVLWFSFALWKKR